jgi:hypothetical protein
MITMKNVFEIKIKVISLRIFKIIKYNEYHLTNDEDTFV